MALGGVEKVLGDSCCQHAGIRKGTGEASKSYFDGAVCETIVAGDLNGDCVIDFRDV